jgi:type III pantothenate kinase
MSTWLFDLGNTRLKCAPLAGDDIGDTIRITHDGQGLSPDWAEVLPDRFDEAVVASVASPASTVALLEALTARCGRITVARTLARFGAVRIAYAEPRRLGVDRFLALVAAHARVAQPWMVVGIGTALTIDLLGADGTHHGGRIAPSPTLMREALQARAPQLPPTGGEFVEFAADTLDALASGCDGAALALIERSLVVASARLETAPALLLHGGGADALRASLRGATWAPDLVLEGLACWARLGNDAA